MIPKIGEWYEHFKGSLYEVVGLAMHTEDMELMVIYQRVDKDNDVTWARPISKWIEPVPGESNIPRFMKVRDVQ